MSRAALAQGSEQTLAQLQQVRGWILDVDGCLVRTERAGGEGGTAFRGAAELVAALKDSGRRVICCTNASEQPPAIYAAGLRELGIPISDSEFVTAGWAGADHIAARHPGMRVLAVGGSGIKEPLRSAGVTLVDARSEELPEVVLVGASTEYPAAALNSAAKAVSAGAPLYVTAGVPWFHGGGARSLSISSAIAAAITSATGVVAEVVGKPSLVLASRLAERLQLPGGQIAVVGDSAPAEMRLASELGALGILLLSGATRPEAVEALPAEEQPDLCFADVGQVHALFGARKSNEGES